MSTYRKEFSQESVWRETLGYSVPLRVFSDPDFGSMDAKESLPAGSSHWECLVFRGLGKHTYGATTTKCRRV